MLNGNLESVEYFTFLNDEIPFKAQWYEYVIEFLEVVGLETSIKSWLLILWWLLIVEYSFASQIIISWIIGLL